MSLALLRQNRRLKIEKARPKTRVLVLGRKTRGWALATHARLSHHDTETDSEIREIE